MHNVARRGSRLSLTGDTELPSVDINAIKMSAGPVEQLAYGTAGHS